MWTRSVLINPEGVPLHGPRRVVSCFRRRNRRGSGGLISATSDLAAMPAAPRRASERGGGSEACRKKTRFVVFMQKETRAAPLNSLRLSLTQSQGRSQVAAAKSLKTVNYSVSAQVITFATFAAVRASHFRFCGLETLVQGKQEREDGGVPESWDARVEGRRAF